MQLELNYPEATAIELPSRDTLLVVVDMQNLYCSPESPTYDGERMGRTVSAIEGLLNLARRSGVKVLHTQSVRRRDALEFTVFKNNVRRIEGTWGAEIIDRLKPAPGESIVVKYTHDCFYESRLEEELRRLGMRPGVSRVIVTGTATRVCVQHAVMGFSVRDYYVYVPMDCTTQTDEAEVLQAFSLFAGVGYRYNVTMTRSDMIKFSP